MAKKLTAKNLKRAIHSHTRMLHIPFERYLTSRKLPDYLSLSFREEGPYELISVIIHRKATGYNIEVATIYLSSWLPFKSKAHFALTTMHGGQSVADFDCLDGLSRALVEVILVRMMDCDHQGLV